VNIPRLAGDFGQVQTYVESCVEQVARDGLTELGRHGGYIDPLNTNYTSTMFSRKLEYNNYDQSESDIAFLDWHDDSTGIPYWYYAKSVDNGNTKCWHCSLSTLAPTVQSMQEQLGIYVDSNLQTCLENFKSFKSQGFDIKSITNSTTTATITGTGVNFYVNYTIQITRNEETQYVEAFYKEIDIPLLQYYMIATNITQNEINTEYLDVYGLYLMGQYSGLDGNKLPPLSAYRTGYGAVFWSKTNTRRSFESLLNSYMQFFRITGTKNDITDTDIASMNSGQIESKMYAAMRLPMFSANDITALDLKDKEINHIYTNSPIYLDVRPSNGDLVSPFVTKDTSQYSKALSTVNPDQDYEFYYDLSYPVIVEISDLRPGHEYKFFVALQGNIKENKVLSDWLGGYGTIPWSTNYVTLYNNIPEGTTLVDPDTGEEYAYNYTTPKPAYFCDNVQRVSGNIRLKTYDTTTEEPLSGVSVTYVCGSYSNCYIGRTEYNESIQDSTFNGKLPLCSNGYAQLDKDGYLTKRIPLSTEYGKTQNLGSAYMEPIIEKNATIKKYNLNRTGYPTQQLTAANFNIEKSSDLESFDSVVITLSKITFDTFDEPWSQTIIFGRDAAENTTSVKLAAGSYTIDAQLLDYNGVKIPKQCKEICVDQNWLGSCKSTQKIPDSDIVIDVAMWGGIEFNENNTFTVTTEDLLSNKSIEFYVVRMPDPKCLDDMNLPSQVIVLSEKYKPELMPKFK